MEVICHNRGIRGRRSGFATTKRANTSDLAREFLDLRQIAESLIDIALVKIVGLPEVFGNGWLLQVGETFHVLLLALEISLMPGEDRSRPHLWNMSHFRYYINFARCEVSIGCCPFDRELGS
jgi:hypothetical protein